MTENIANRQSHNATSISSSDMRVLNAISRLLEKAIMLKLGRQRTAHFPSTMLRRANKFNIKPMLNREY